MPTGAWFGSAVVLAVGVSVMLVFLVLVPRLARASWGRWHAPFPAREPAADAVRRRFQSFSVGMLSLGYSVHVAVDDECLHLTPAGLVRGFGLRAVSIPWERVEVAGAFPLAQRRAVIAGVRVVGPAWCLDVAGTGG